MISSFSKEFDSLHNATLLLAIVIY